MVSFAVEGGISKITERACPAKYALNSSAGEGVSIDKIENISERACPAKYASTENERACPAKYNNNCRVKSKVQVSSSKAVSQ